VRRAARLLQYGGIVVAVLGLSKLHSSSIAANPYDYTTSARFGWSIVYMVVLGIAAYGFGLPDLPRSPRGALAAGVAASATAALGISVVQLAVGDALLPRFVVFGSAIALVPWYLICVIVANEGRQMEQDRDRVVLVGTSADGDALREELRRSAERPAVITAVISPDHARPSIDGRRPLQELVERTGATLVVLDRESQADESIVHQAADLHEQGVRMRTQSLFYEQWLGKLPLSELERVSLMFDIGEIHRARYGRLKRMLDVIFGVLGLAVLVVAIPFVLVGNLVANRGPLFYRQPRVGKNGEVFEIKKFRTMSASVNPEGEWTAADDPRVTPFGRVLRRAHLDELPQALNMLAGELSMVGPRPEQPHYVDELTEKIPFYDLRHLVRPGLTGWAQVKYHYGADEIDAMEKLQYEFYYLRHQRLSLDLRVIGRTIRSVMGGEGR
jgi:lipopolysaccharide/colanic/teichoic acid biosynthesis glycosyltransferase